jgi:hypothetical protein
MTGREELPVVHKVGCAWLAVDESDPNVGDEDEGRLCSCGEFARARERDDRRRIQT